MSDQPKVPRLRIVARVAVPQSDLREQLEAWIEDCTRGEGCLLADGFDEAFVGVLPTDDGFCAVYSMGECLHILETRDGMTPDDAAEFFEFNVVGASVGNKSPIYVHSFKRRP